MNQNVPADKVRAKKSVPRDTDRFVDISGQGQNGRPKSHVMVRYFIQYSDGSTKDIQTLFFDKPIVNVFAHSGYANVHLDFGSNEDVDLRILWEMLTGYSQAQNSVSYLPEELERGYYDAGDGQQIMVYFPVLELILSPIGKESEYQIQGYNPAFFTLAPNSLKGEPCVVQFTFSEDWLIVVNDLEPVDFSRIQQEVMDEIRADMDNKTILTDSEQGK